VNHRACESRRGVTLVELMLVMGMIALLLGVGVGLLTQLNPGEKAAVGLVQSTIRSAHNSAVARTAPARARIDHAARSITAEGLHVIGTWHFEDERLSGAFDLDGVAFGSGEAPLSEDGYQGRCVSFEGAQSGARIEFAVQDDPAWDLRDGFSIDMAVKLAALGGAQLLSLGGVVEIQVDSRGGLRAAFASETTDESGRIAKGAPVYVETVPGVLRPGHWTRLRMVYDRAVLRLLADGVEVVRRHEGVPVFPKLGGPLVLAGGREPFRGALDNLVVSAVAAAEVAVLPGGVRFGADAPTEVLFAPGGALDPTRHREPVRVPLEFEDGQRVVVLVGLYGTVE
jgi:hypothetical protein